MSGIGPGASQLGGLDQRKVLLRVDLATEGLDALPASRVAIARAVADGSVADALFDRCHQLRPLLVPRACIDPAGLDEGVQVAGGDADVAAELDVGDAALEHQPAHAPHPL